MSRKPSTYVVVAGTLNIVLAGLTQGVSRLLSIAAAAICGVALFGLRRKTSPAVAPPPEQAQVPLPEPGDSALRALDVTQAPTTQPAPITMPGQTGGEGASQVEPVFPTAYGTDPLDNRSLVALIEDCVQLYDEIDTLVGKLKPAQQGIAGHVLLRLQEVMVRSGVGLIEGDTVFHYERHQVAPTGTLPANVTPITATLSPGFSLGRRVLRRARVSLAAPEQDGAVDD